jgi:hypothetical protein
MQPTIPAEGAEMVEVVVEETGVAAEAIAADLTTTAPNPTKMPTLSTIAMPTTTTTTDGIGNSATSLLPIRTFMNTLKKRDLAYRRMTTGCALSVVLDLTLLNTVHTFLRNPQLHGSAIATCGLIQLPYKSTRSNS